MLNTDTMYSFKTLPISYSSTHIFPHSLWRGPTLSLSVLFLIYWMNLFRILLYLVLKDIRWSLLIPFLSIFLKLFNISMVLLGPSCVYLTYASSLFLTRPLISLINQSSLILPGCPSFTLQRVEAQSTYHLLIGQSPITEIDRVNLCFNSCIIIVYFII